MGASASFTPSNKARREKVDQEQSPPDYSDAQRRECHDTSSNDRKRRVKVRIDDQNKELSDTPYNSLKVQQQRPGMLPPIGDIQSLKPSITQSTNKQSQNKRKQKDNRIKELEKENKILRSEIDSLQLQHEHDVIYCRELKREADDLKLRISKIASDRLTDNNPNITDLSDENRPLVVGAKFSELYSNEWSDIFEELTADGRRSEKDAIDVLLELLRMIFEECKRKAEQDIDNVRHAIQACTGYVEVNEQLSSSLKLLKLKRKQNYQATSPELLTTLEILLPNEEKTETKQTYVREATEICWLMCIHDPPLVLHYCTENNHFSEDYFTPYTKTGDIVDYLVWPALLLHQNGPVLQKGVAQAKKRGH